MLRRAKLTEEEIQEKLEEFNTLGEAVEWLRFLELGGEPAKFGQGKILVFEGRIGAGMTLSAVVLAHNDYLWGRTVYSNIKLNFPYKPLEKLNFDKAVSCSVLIDDCFVLVDSRLPTTKTVRIWTYFLSQVRKRGITVYLTTPRFEYLDKRIRWMTDVRVYCYCTAPHKFAMRFVTLQTGSKSIYPYDGRPYYGLYNTWQTVVKP